MLLLQRRLLVPVDLTLLVAFRVLFGLLMAGSALRFMLSGFIERFFGERSFFFKYWGFEWVEPSSVEGMYFVYALLALFGFMIALGLYYRIATVAFFLLFTYAELTDVTNYLNHYYLVSLLSVLLCFMPLSGKWSLDVWRKPALSRASVPAWMLYLLRFQIGVVYFSAALAKIGSDWLLHGQPLGLWLSAHSDLPVIGRYLLLPSVALFASWAGFLHDLLIVPLLLIRRTRPYAYAALLFFHLMTSTWFNIGIFPLLMPLGALLFFDHADFARFSALGRSASSRPPPRLTSRPWELWPVAAYCVLQVALPLRAHLYGGNVLWHEQGMRYSFRVMLRDKHGSVAYRVHLTDGRELVVPPRRYLSMEQEREMSSQPDLILQLAHHIARDFESRGFGRVAVYVDALVSLNGRPPVPMIDPKIDLTQLDDGLAPAAWILPSPVTPPFELAPRGQVALFSP